jgi:enediyne biosynthesis protein E2
MYVPMIDTGGAMPTMLGSLRRLVLTPSLTEVGFARRGFPVVESDVTRMLEAVPQAVVCGFEWGIDARDQWEVERRLSLVTPEHRGFAYEGVTMAFTILDAMRGGRGIRTRNLLRGPGQPHIFLAYIGIGFAMARLPRPLWRNVIPDLTGTPYHPTMSWFAVDGYGFDRAYFETERWVDRQEILAPYPFQGAPEYFSRAVDQGIGRALWFIHGAGVREVAAAVNRFAEPRRADLWSGVGLAATFAGGGTPQGLAALRHVAGNAWTELAQGAVFAAKARTYSGTVPQHTEAAVSVLAGMTVESATSLADDVAINDAHSGSEPAYEQWRRHIREHFYTHSLM